MKTMLRRFAHHAPPVDKAKPRHRLGAEKDILRDGQIRRDAELLMHHADPGVARIAG